jgi:hypothetical protein
MANTIAYTSGNSLTGSLKSGVISINLNDQIIGQNYNWRNGLVFSNQYIIYSDTFTQGIDTEVNAKPCAWACDYNNTALLNLINSLPPLIGQPKYATLASAIAWLQGQNKYFIVNQNYPTIVTDSLRLLYDAGLTGSYPTLGTTFYDVSGNGSNGTIYNSPTFFNSGATSYFAFDGTDDTILSPLTLSDLPALSNFTLECCAMLDEYPTAPGGNQKAGVLFGATYYSGVALYWLGNSSGNGASMHSFIRGNDAYRLSPGFSLALNRYYHFVLVNNYSANTLQLYVNGSLIDSIGTATQQYNSELATIAGQIGVSKAQVDGGGTLAYSYWNGMVSKSGIYTKALSASEIAQNAYLGPIVTSGIVAAYDSGNIVSYPGTSTTWYDMVGSNNATLLNGITYNLNQGGVLNFDGTDDSASIAYNSALDPTGGITLEAWVKPFNIANSTFVEIYRKETGSARQLFSFQDGGTILSFGTGTAGGYDELDVSINASDYNGQWVHLVASYTSGFKAIYRNGVLIGSATNVTGNLLQSTGTSYIGSIGGSGEFFFGEYAIFRMYNRGLNATEVLQNYSAQRNRFQSNQAFANGGTVSTVIENGINYRVHTFTSSGTLTVLSAGIVEVLTVAGGGGGGAYAAGAGAGAGGVLFNTDYSVTTGNKTVTIGGGGAGQDYTVTNPSNGSNSVMDSLTAVGGGYGGQGWGGNVGGNGGSGGGGAGYDGTQGTFTTAGGTGTPGQGFNGGIGRGISGNRGAGGGGGGAGLPGGDSTTNSGGDGGNGRQISINGTATYYGGGGGGGDYGSANGGQGGLGGGGNVSGGNGSGVPGGNGGTNTGGGGGGSRSATSERWNCGNGRSGKVIIRYRI